MGTQILAVTTVVKLPKWKSVILKNVVGVALPKFPNVIDFG